MQKNQFLQANRTGDMFSYGRVPTESGVLPSGGKIEKNTKPIIFQNPVT